MNCSNIKLFEKQLDEIYHAAVLQLLVLYKEEFVDYFNIMIPKAIDGKRKSNKVIKLLANMDTFAQSDYERDSLHILIKKIDEIVLGLHNQAQEQILVLTVIFGFK